MQQQRLTTIHWQIVNRSIHNIAVMAATAELEGAPLVEAVLLLVGPAAVVEEGGGPI
jgi:hypothetical protein